MTPDGATGEELARATSPRLAAEMYASMGWPVVPTAGIVSGRCGCRLGPKCENHIGKHPLNPGGVSEPSTDRRTIGGWWDRWPWAGVGIATGPTSGLLVVDVDLKQGGPATIERLRNEGIDLTQTLTAQTGSGGRHYLFSVPDGRWAPSTVGNIPGIGETPGVDLRGAGTFIVAAPSPHISGGRYQWDRESGSLTPLPLALLETMEQSRTSEHRITQAAPSISIELHGEMTPYARKAYEGEIDRVRNASAERNATLFHAAKRLGRLVGGGQLPREHAEAGLEAAAITAGLAEGETRRTVASGINTGMKEPRFPSPPPSSPRRSQRGRETKSPPDHPPPKSPFTEVTVDRER